MATLLSYLPAHSSQSPRAVLRGAGVALLNLVMAWQARAEQRSALRSMDPRLLRDMGVDFTEAMIEAEKPFWKA